MKFLKKEPVFSFLVLAFIVTIFFGLATLLNKCEKEKTYNKFLDDSVDSVMIYKNKAGEWEAQSKILYGDVDMLKSKVLSKDSTIAKLQKLVNKKTISATVINTTTTSTDSTPTTVVSASGDSCVYETSWETAWERGFIRADKNNIYRDIKIRNEFHITQDFKKNGIFKPDVPVVTIRNLNPNTQTTELKTFTVAQKKPYRGVWFAVGGVVVFVIKMLL